MNKTLSMNDGTVFNAQYSLVRMHRQIQTKDHGMLLAHYALHRRADNIM